MRGLPGRKQCRRSKQDGPCFLQGNLLHVVLEFDCGLDPRKCTVTGIQHVAGKVGDFLVDKTFRAAHLKISKLQFRSVSATLAGPEGEGAGPRKNNKYTAARLNKVATAMTAGCRKIPADSFSGSGNGDSNPSCIFFPISAAQCQPENKRFRQVGFIHSRLHRRNIVRYAPEFHDFVIEIGNRKSGAGIAVARLSD